MASNPDTPTWTRALAATVALALVALPAAAGPAAAESPGPEDCEESDLPAIKHLCAEVDTQEGPVEFRVEAEEGVIPTP